MRKKIIFLIIIAASAVTFFWFYSYVVFKRKYVVARYINHHNWEKRAHLFSRIKKQNHKYLFIGDSMTENLRLYLPESDSVANMGIGGDFTDGLIKRIDNITRFNPRKLFLMIGINDIIEKVPLPEIQKNYSEIIKLVKRDCPDTEIYIQSTIPTYGLKGNITSGRSINKRVGKLNDFLKILAKKEKVIYIDLYAGFCNQKYELKPGLTSDGIHLNDKGYMLWLKYLEPYIK